MNGLSVLLNILQIAAAASILILFLWILDRFINMKHGHLWRKWLWGLLCIRLLFPFPIHPKDLVESGRGIQVEVTIPQELLPESVTGPAFAFDFSLSPLVYLLIIWLAGLLFLLRFRAAQYLHMKKLYVETAEPLEKEELRLWEQKCQKQYGRRRLPEIQKQEDVTSPMLFGCVHKTLLVPPGAYRTEELELIMRHELLHAKHGDLWYKLLVMLVCDLYWFNPIFRLMKSLAFQDVEYVCDERVTKNMNAPERKTYGNVILKTMQGTDSRNLPLSTQFAANKKAVKKRLGNLFVNADLRRGVPVLAALILIFSVSTVGIVVTGRYTGKMNKTAGGIIAENLDQAAKPLPVYLVDDKESLHLKEDFRLENYYMRSVCRVSNYYYIDENNILWGYGANEFGQLGLGQRSEAICTPQKIAENVIHVDFSGEYFAIFLTADGKLYGIGDFPNPTDTVTAFPVLLMEDVSYARCGYRHIVAMKKDGSVWWWGEIHMGISSTGWQKFTSGSNGPVKVLENARYVTSGNEVMAAILEDDSLWMWGNNAVGSCGVSSDVSDFVEKPQKAAEQVKMVWIERLPGPDPEGSFRLDSTRHEENSYDYTTFIEKMDGKIFACGLDVPGTRTKNMPRYYAEVFEPQMLSFTEEFVPVRFVQRDISAEEEGWDYEF